MRRSLFLLAPLGFAAFSFACEDDPQNNPSTSFPEAGTFDSGRPIDDSGRPPEDANPDAPVTPKGVTVLATSRTGPAANITVLFHDATGAITETKKTGADGKATSVPTPTPAMATIIFGEGTGNRRLVTWTSVADGDELPAVVPEEDLNLGQVEITLTGQFDAGVYNYDSYVGRCYQYGGTGTEPWYISPYVGCARGGGALLVEAQDVDQSNKVVGFSFKKPITLDADGGTLAVTPGAWVAPVDITLAVSNTTSISGNGIFSQIAGSTVFAKRSYLDDSFGATFPAAGPTFADAYNMAVTFPGSNPTNQRIIGRRFATNTTAVTLDANTLPPELTAASIDQADKHRPIAKWTGTMTGMKGGIVRIFYANFAGDAYATTGWTLVVPSTVTEIKAPMLPASLDPILPSPDAGVYTWDSSPTVAFADSTLLPDYGAFRKVQGLVFPLVDENADFEEAVPPQAGDFKITSWHTLPE
jgi:hypothetical protein